MLNYEELLYCLCSLINLHFNWLRKKYWFVRQPPYHLWVGEPLIRNKLKRFRRGSVLHVLFKDAKHVGLDGRHNESSCKCNIYIYTKDKNFSH